MSAFQLGYVLLLRLCVLQYINDGEYTVVASDVVLSRSM